jgi:phage terminase Nu1 subunit (DNA packaging protein)
MPTKRTKPRANVVDPIDPTSDLAASIFGEALTAILAEIRGIRAGKIKPKGHDAASRIAWLAQRAASVAAEQRKAEAAELRKLTPAVVMIWIRQQTAEYRARLLRDVTAIDSKERRSVLG